MLLISTQRITHQGILEKRDAIGKIQTEIAQRTQAWQIVTKEAAQIISRRLHQQGFFPPRTLVALQKALITNVVPRLPRSEQLGQDFRILKPRLMP
jgi:hypothetical protein